MRGLEPEYAAQIYFYMNFQQFFQKKDTVFWTNVLIENKQYEMASF